MRKMLADLWDDDNVIEPLRNVSKRSRDLSVKLQHRMLEINVANEMA